MSEEQTVRLLWQNYRFLTKEMLKFLDKHDMDLFYKLLAQRAELQTQIEAAVDDGFKDSEEGRKTLTEIQHDDRLLLNHLQMKRHKVNEQRKVIGAYSGPSTARIKSKVWER